MVRLRFMAVAVLALALAGNSVQTGRSAGQSDGPSLLAASYAEINRTKSSAANDSTCVIYSLTDMGYDGDLSRWIAQTIPEMIESKSWQQSGGSGALRYYAPKNILVVNQSAEIQAKVNGFLKNLRTSLPKTNHASAATKKSSRGSVVPADYRAPALVGASAPLPESSGYPVPAPVKAPKHLFHFLIRYEGEGIIDDNVVKFMKVQNLVRNCATPGTATVSGNSYPPGTTIPSACAPVGGMPNQGYCPVGPAVSGSPAPTFAPSAPVASPTTSTIPPTVLATSPLLASPVAEPTQKKDTKKKEEKPGSKPQS